MSVVTILSRHVVLGTASQPKRLFCLVSALHQGRLKEIIKFNPSLSYKLWSPFAVVIASICLPVDVLIFFAEPFGVWGTLVILVIAFIPFVTLQAIKIISIIIKT